MSTSDRLHASMDAIAEGLIEVFNLRFRREVGHLDSPVMRWFDFRLRHVEAAPRTVIASDRFPKILTPEAAKGLLQLIAMFERGEDVNPYQGRGLRLRNDTSGEKFYARTDPLYADWGILHFHLPNGPIPAGQYFSKPSDWLAFCWVADGQVALIDVQLHGDRAGFSAPDLLATALRSWPEWAERYRIKGVGADSSFTKEDVHAFREAGVNRFFAMDGALYAGPGDGLTAAGVPYRVVRAQYLASDFIDQVVIDIDNPGSQFRSSPSVRGVKNPEFDLRLHEDGLGLFERVSKTFFRTESIALAANRQRLSGLSDLLIPHWSLPEIRSAKTRFDELWCEPALPDAANLF